MKPYRVSMLELFRPPPGYRLRAGVGSSFSVELDVLIAALLALTGVEESEDPVAQLDAVMEVSGAFRLFVNRGSIRHGPRSSPAPLVALLDRIIVDIPLLNTSFHPKVWALEFEPREGTAGGAPLRYRLLCGSRNLTAARTWELAARLEGSARADTGAHDPLAASAAKFVARCLRDLTAVEPLKSMPSRLARAKFAPLPRSDKGLSLLWQWTGEKVPPERRLALPLEARRLLVVSPFLDAAFLDEVATCAEVILVSTQQALDALDGERVQEIARKGSVHVVRGRNAVDGVEPLELHAKLVAWETRSSRATLVGSANATGRGFGLRGAKQRNVEAMVCLRPGIQIDRFTREFIRQPWVGKYVRGKPSAADAERRKMTDLLSMLAKRLGLSGAWDASSEKLRITAKLQPRDANCEEAVALATIGPLCLDASADVPLGEALEFRGAEYAGVDAARVSRFARLRISGGGSLPPAETILVMDLPLDEHRDAEARKVLLSNADPVGLLRAAIGVERVARTRETTKEPPSSGDRPPPGAALTFDAPTLEQVLRACIDSPRSFEKLHRIVEARPDVKVLMPYWDALAEALPRAPGVRDV